MWQPATERLQHFQTMLKTKLNVLTLKKEPLPTVIFHEPEAIELRSTTPLMKTRTHMGYKVTYLGKVTITGTQFLSGCTESAVIGLWERRALVQDDVLNANAILEIRPFQHIVRISGRRYGERPATLDSPCSVDGNPDAEFTQRARNPDRLRVPEPDWRQLRQEEQLPDLIWLCALIMPCL
ncbi:PTB-containing, cubilin and LRP1-interacting protein isoform X4 [Paramormyrops kingsleyae]|uniref:PTB-containing, cubilin and LRP1-interacting protein isoform X4 n=1 Tax=Paramormyrops kingsleyae TaxID=1676925 RepID=UPI000CD62A57|nr:PTB-containing, cubilin and LRP1-interacting protein isoform X4 [Paramormyrops kingsleyae]